MTVGRAWTVRREAEPPPPLPRERKVGGRVRECGGERLGKKWWGARLSRGLTRERLTYWSGEKKWTKF
jgi:hypothetical protein